MTALTSATAIRAGVVALREERLRGLDPEGNAYALQSEALDAVLRLIDTGHWREIQPGEIVRDGTPVVSAADSPRRDPLTDPLLAASGKIGPEEARRLGLDVPDVPYDLDARTVEALRRVSGFQAEAEALRAEADPPTVVVPLDPPDRPLLIRTDPEESVRIAESTHGPRPAERRKRGTYDRTCDACIRGDGVVEHTHPT